MLKGSAYLKYAWPGLILAAWPGVVQAQGWAVCDATDNIFASGSRHFTLRTNVFPTDLAKEDLTREWGAKVNEISLRTEKERGFGYSFGKCDLWKNRNDAETVWRNRNAYDARRNRTVVPVDFKPATAGADTGVRHTTRARWPKAGNNGGYEAASIGVSYQFLSCAGDIVMAYAIDPKSVQVGPNYSRRDFKTVSTAGAAVPEPSAITLRGTIRFDLSKDPNNAAGRRFNSQKFYDEFAGDALGFGCFTGQTRSIGKIADLVGPKPAKGEVLAFLAGLRFSNLTADNGPLQNAALDSGAREDVAKNLAREKAEAERVAKELAEAENLKRQQAETERARAALAARSEAIRKARAEELAKYERELAASRAAEQKYARDLKAFEAESRRVAAARAEYERKMEEYRRAIASTQKAAKPD